MGSPESRVGDDEEWEGGERKKHRSRKSGNGEEGEGLDGGGRRRGYGDSRTESRKRSSGSSRADSDDNGYDSRRAKQMKKRQEESTLEKLSSWYEDGEFENKQDGSKVHSRGDEGERRKISSKQIDHDGSQSRSRSKEDRLHDREVEKMDKDCRHSEKKESNRQKVHGSSEQVKSSRRRWDEADTIKNTEDGYSEKGDYRNAKASDNKYQSSRERSGSVRTEPGESKSKGLDSGREKVVKSTHKEDRVADLERGKSKGRSEPQDISCEDNMLDKDRIEKPRRQRTPSSYDVAESWDRPLNADEDGNTRIRDKTPREAGRTNRSRTPERRKEIDKDDYRDDRSKGKDDTWNDGNKDRESWKRRQLSSIDRDSTNGDIVYDNNREWELHRHGRERTDNERPHGRSGGRKDVSRGDAVKISSNFGISNGNYDVIEIQTKSNDYGKSESMSNFSRRTEANQQYNVKLGSNDEEWAYHQGERARRSDSCGTGTPGEDLKERYADDDNDFYGGRGRGQKVAGSVRSTGGGSHPQYGNQESRSFNRAGPHGLKGNRVGRGGRVRPIGRDNQQVGMPLPMMGSPYAPLGMPPPGPMQPLTHGMSPSPCPPISPGVFISPFTQAVWPGARGVDMNLLAVPPTLSPVPPGPSVPRFPAANIGNPPNPAMYYNQSGLGRGVPPGISSHGFNSAGPMTRGAPADKTSGGWVPPKSSGAPGKAPSRGEQNDYSQNFVDTGMRPQNFIRELELTSVVEDYPKLRELIQKKDEIVTNSSSAPMYYKCNLKEFELSPEFFGTKFDVILVDPPWEEYVHRAPGVADHMEYWTFEEIMNLKIEAIADTPSFIFLWVGDGVGLEQGRQCLKKWGFRRCEDICWAKTNKTNATPGLRHDSHTLFQHSKEHCLMGIKGTVRRSTDGHIIHANIDTDVIIAEEPPYGSTQKPEDMYRIIEHFSLGRRRLELFGEDHNIRSGWVTVGKELSSSNFNAEGYMKNFADKDGKVWQGGGGRNPPPEAPHLVVTTPDIEALRPKSPMKNQQQQQSVSIPLTTTNSSNRRPTGNSPQNPTALGLNQDASSSNPSTPAPWSSPLDGFKAREGSVVPSDGKAFDVYGFNGPAPANYVDFEPSRQMNLM
ncbi:N6-adenosine-methyltransferase non-catalytic subunit MTB-like isoform X2 [Gastrolobium bilobum]|uniref:N6-adenosine-methyltransferase non-catalytic subunit MTB-like isoform X2 n=1 Tax=Gastrolobium bilobum TaxID=150636 RepID=UPI002AB1DC44|nr:N6-adenosine-methyltransferase non-catalytic subunit MTB-like isoform X2 [Gastrolobium bilobum]